MVAGIALGSNLASGFGLPQQNLLVAVERVGGLGRVTAVSGFFDTAPVGYLEQPRFVNGALLLDTELEAVALLRGLLAIELAMGRRRDLVVNKGPRIIDLDLLFYGDLVLATTELTLPHPAMAERPFVLEPLAEIAPGWVHPVSGLSVAQMLKVLRSGWLEDGFVSG